MIHTKCEPFHKKKETLSCLWSKSFCSSMNFICPWMFGQFLPYVLDILNKFWVRKIFMRSLGLRCPIPISIHQISILWKKLSRILAWILYFSKYWSIDTSNPILESIPILNVLQLLEITTKIVCGEKYETASKIIPGVDIIGKKLMEINLKNKISNQLKSNAMNNFKSCFLNL